jgi:hypothetical protein
MDVALISSPRRRSAREARGVSHGARRRQESRVAAHRDRVSVAREGHPAHRAHRRDQHAPRDAADRPRLAIARADQRQVRYWRYRNWNPRWRRSRPSAFVRARPSSGRAVRYPAQRPRVAATGRSTEVWSRATRSCRSCRRTCASANTARCARSTRISSCGKSSVGGQAHRREPRSRSVPPAAHRGRSLRRRRRVGSHRRRARHHARSRAELSAGAMRDPIYDGRPRCARLLESGGGTAPAPVA